MRSDAVDVAYENLANQIIVQAVNDYRGLLDGAPPSADVNINEVERFFRSNWCTMLSPRLNGIDLMNKIRKEFNLETYIDTSNT